jgi:recombination protein RecT
MISAVFCCAETGLVPDTPLAECHLIPYGSTVQWIPGYRGLMKLARQSGGITRFDVAIVRDEDEFRVTRGTNPEIVHIPSMGVGTTNRGEMTHVYSVAWFRDGSPPHFEVMDREEIDLIKNEASKNKRSTPWQAHYEEMARKTIVRRHCKYLDLTPQAGLAVDMDNAVASGKDQQFHEAAVGAFETDEPTTQTADELAESLSVNTKTGEVEES